MPTVWTGTWPFIWQSSIRGSCGAEELASELPTGDYPAATLIS
ncbi:hypothetical protein BH11MYX4_BH11MYX4_45640 [soil metagenome]